MSYIEYCTNSPVTAVQLADLFDGSGIRRPIGDLLRIQQMIDRADLIITAWDGEKIVGVARSLTDFCYCCYLSDLAVHREYQRQGIGKDLVNRTRKAIGDRTALILLAAPEAMDYYPKIGLLPITNGWMIKRTK
jgi:ribosomal protein S18 acetylase RimI-like enzyme